MERSPAYVPLLRAAAAVSLLLLLSASYAVARVPEFHRALMTTGDCGSCQQTSCAPPVCSLAPSPNPITIISIEHGTVTFSVCQTFKGSALSYFLVNTGPGNCPKFEEKPNGYCTPPLTTPCVDGYAYVTIYIHDGQIARTPDITSSIPAYCRASRDQGKKCSFTYRIGCGCPEPPIVTIELSPPPPSPPPSPSGSTCAAAGASCSNTFPCCDRDRICSPNTATCVLSPGYLCPGAALGSPSLCVDGKVANCIPPAISTAADTCSPNCGDNCAALCLAICGRPNAPQNICRGTGGNCAGATAATWTGPCCTCDCNRY